MPQAKQRGEYSPEWPAIALKTKDDANWCCIRCGHPHDLPSGHVLTVHHFDGNKSNCAESNLMALCQRCHLSVQARVDPSIPIMFKPSTWALPFVASIHSSNPSVLPLSTYDLADWIRTFEEETGKQWPKWAPKESDNERKPSPHSGTTSGDRGSRRKPEVRRE